MPFSPSSDIPTARSADTPSIAAPLLPWPRPGPSLCALSLRSCPAPFAALTFLTPPPPRPPPYPALALQGAFYAQHIKDWDKDLPGLHETNKRLLTVGEGYEVLNADDALFICPAFFDLGVDGVADFPSTQLLTAATEVCKCVAGRSVGRPRSWRRIRVSHRAVCSCRRTHVRCCGQSPKVVAVG